MNLGTLKTALQRFGFDTSDPLTIWLNAALHDFEDQFDWPFLESFSSSLTTASGVTGVTLPTDLFKIYKLRLTDQQTPLDYVDRVTFEDNSDTVASGTPQIYTMQGLSTVLLSPIPDAVYNLRLFYQSFLADMVSDTDVPAIPLRYHYAIVQKAAAIGLMAENEEDRAATQQGEYDSIVEVAKGKFSTHQLGSLGQVRDTQGYAS